MPQLPSSRTPDAQRRYATAGELADELERWQRHEPIRARPAGPWERGVKWVRRNRAQAALLATVVSAGFILTAVSLLFNLRLDRARTLAEANAAQTRQALVRHQLHEASRLIEERRPFSALWPALWALRLGDGKAETDHAARRRVAGILTFSPRLFRLWTTDAPVTLLQFSEDGEVLAGTLAGGHRQAWALPMPGAVPAALLEAKRFATNVLAATNLASASEHRLRTIAGFWSDLGEEKSGDVSLSLTSPDGAWGVTASIDSTVRVTRISDGRPIGPVLTHHSSVTALAMSGDSRLLGSAPRMA